MVEALLAPLTSSPQSLQNVWAPEIEITEGSQRRGPRVWKLCLTCGTEAQENRVGSGSAWREMPRWPPQLLLESGWVGAEVRPAPSDLC